MNCLWVLRLPVEHQVWTRWIAPTGLRPPRNVLELKTSEAPSPKEKRVKLFFCFSTFFSSTFFLINIPIVGPHWGNRHGNRLWTRWPWRFIYDFCATGLVRSRLTHSWLISIFYSQCHRPNSIGRHLTSMGGESWRQNFRKFHLPPKKKIGRHSRHFTESNSFQLRAHQRHGSIPTSDFFKNKMLKRRKKQNVHTFMHTVGLIVTKRADRD